MPSTASTRNQDPAAAALRQSAVSLTPDAEVAEILTQIGDAPIVLLGEASHGTHDFYALRARITQALIEQRGFTAVAIEGDWPDAYRVNRFVHGASSDAGAAAALAGFERFPTWMWRNSAVEAFIAWLRRRNAATSDPRARASFYGLDLYSLHASMRAVVEYLEARDPEAAAEAKASYSCFERFGHDAETYAWATARLEEGSCEEAVARELVRLRRERDMLLQTEPIGGTDEFFYAEQNARLAANAERYYRTMFHGRTESWNIRDRHMAETLDALLLHLQQQARPEKMVVWAHNSHLGDARATEMGEHGELNLGQLVREEFGERAKLIGFTTYEGSVMAAHDWGEAGARMKVQPALAGSYEELFHEAGLDRHLIPVREPGELRDFLMAPRLERAIGVIYRPATERQSHYFRCCLPNQFDFVIHLDRTEAVTPLDHKRKSATEEAPETYPTGV